MLLILDVGFHVRDLGRKKRQHSKKEIEFNTYFPYSVLQQHCCFLTKSYLVVDTSELPAPAGVIEERTKVKAVVVGTVALCMVGRCQRCHLVAVHRIHPEEVFHLLGHLYRDNSLLNLIFLVFVLNNIQYVTGKNFKIWEEKRNGVYLIRIKIVTANTSQFNSIDSVSYVIFFICLVCTSKFHQNDNVWGSGVVVGRTSTVVVLLIKLLFSLIFCKSVMLCAFCWAPPACHLFFHKLDPFEHFLSI